MVKLHADGLTQVQIAQRLDCTQPVVSKWLDQFSDSTEHAKLYLRGSALKMSQNIVKNGRAADHVAALKGLSVLKDDTSQHITVLVGGPGQVNIGAELSPPVTVTLGEGKPIPQQKPTQSDNQSYVNHAKLLIEHE
jgi:hypothetical protein